MNLCNIKLAGVAFGLQVFCSILDSSNFLTALDCLTSVQLLESLGWWVGLAQSKMSRMNYDL